MNCKYINLVIDYMKNQGLNELIIKSGGFYSLDGSRTRIEGLAPSRVYNESSQIDNQEISNVYLTKCNKSFILRRKEVA